MKNFFGSMEVLAGAGTLIAIFFMMTCAFVLERMDKAKQKAEEIKDKEDKYF